MKTLLLYGYLFLFFLFPFMGQAEVRDSLIVPCTVNEATLLSLGAFNLKDTYLSDLTYTGIGYQLMHERMKRMNWMHQRITNQQMVHLYYAKADNPSFTATNSVYMIDGEWGYYYNYRPLPHLKVLAGSALWGQGGMIYNSRNGNNPGSAKLAIDLNLSALVIYELKIKNYPLTFRGQVSVPTIGVCFSPNYGQSYYEMYVLDNNHNVLNFTHYGNRIGIRSYMTVDFPVGDFIFRLGYMGSYRKTNINHIESHIQSHSILFGIVKEFSLFKGKKAHSNQIKSAFYE